MLAARQEVGAGDTPYEQARAGVFVYKFKCAGQLALLAYEYDPATRLLLLLGTHENFCRELKRS